MKEIKFRAWIPDAEMGADDMFYQEDQFLSSFLKRIYQAYVVSHPAYLKFELEERLMQIIGSKDKNNKDIYENDIFEDGSFCIFIGNRYVKMWLSKDENGRNHWEDITEDDVVVGNTFENPELLTKETK